MDTIRDFLNSHSRGGMLPWAVEDRASKRFSLSYRDVEIASLEAGLVPVRYWKNGTTLSMKDQMSLLKSHAAVIGCGGLGGYVLEALARVGIGTLTIIDPDIFEEHNLNRQIFCTVNVLGMPKVEVATARIMEVNPAVEVIAKKDAYTRAKSQEMLRGVQVAVDGLDTISDRIELGDACSTLGIPLVHGSIGGWYGQITTQMPGRHNVQEIYQNFSGEVGIEKNLGNPSFSPALIASLQAAEVCKVLLGTGHCLTRRMLFFNLLDMEMETLEL